MNRATREDLVELLNQANKSGLDMFLLTDVAGRSILSLFKRLELDRNNHIIVVVGGGANGACGIAAARNLMNMKYQVQLIVLNEPERECARRQLQIAEEMHVPIWYWRDESSKCADLIGGADIIIEAIVGHGLQNKMSDDLVDFIEGINYVNKKVISFDIPAGFDVQNGLPTNTCVKPDVILALGLDRKSVV